MSTDNTTYDGGIDPDYGIPSEESRARMSLPDLQGLAIFSFDSGLPATADSSKIAVGSPSEGMHLDHTIHVAYRSGFSTDGSSTNLCLENLTDGRSKGHWKGPLLLYCMTKVVTSSNTVDAHASDLSISLEGILHQQGQGMIQKKIKGVKVDPSKPFFEPIDVPLKHPIFTNGLTSAFCTLVDMPCYFFISSCGKDLKKVTMSGIPAVPAAYLHFVLSSSIEYYRKKHDLGDVPHGWLHCTRSILMVTEGGPDMSVKLAKALCTVARGENHGISAARHSNAGAQRYLDQHITERALRRALDRVVESYDDLKPDDSDLGSKFGEMTFYQYQRLRDQ